MAKVKDRTIKSSTPVKNKCKDCGTEYMANKVEYSNGDVIITPPRCESCQIRHLTNIRVGKVLKDLDLVGNLKLRLTKAQRAAIIDAITNKLNEVYERFSGVVIAQGGFDLAKIEEPAEEPA